MLTLTPHEARVLGVLVEKALTVPAQYPLTLNGLTVGCNQKNNRHPVMNLTEDDVFDAVEMLRQKGLVREAMLSGSRVAKYRHLSREVLNVETPALVVLTELMLRGPQSLGELRQNASRMHALESTEAVKAVLDELASREEPLVKEYPPPPGGRARVYRQLLAPTAHGEPAAATADGLAEESDAPRIRPSPPSEAGAGMAARLEALEGEVARLRGVVERLAQDLGAKM